MKQSTKKTSPWAWIPTLYFAQGLPYVAVMTISVIMYKRLGISNTDIALYTGWLYLPWVIKPFWSPFVDLIKTKRWWTVVMQYILAFALAGIAFSIPTPFFFQLTLAVFWIVGFTSATHDIAADGFYMHALTEHEQSLYVGIRSTFYRIATVAGQGLLVIIAGLIETGTGLEPAMLQVQASPSYTNTLTLPDFEDTNIDTQKEAYFVYTSPIVQAGVTATADNDSVDIKTRIAELEKAVKASNIANHFVPAEKAKEGDATVKAEKKESTFTAWVRETFGEKREVAEGAVDNVAIVGVRLSKQPSADETKILNVTFKDGDQSIKLEQNSLSTRFEFTAENWDKPAYLLFRIDHKIKNETSATFEGASGNIPFAWLIVFIVLSGFFFAVSIYHNWILPKPASDRPSKDVTAQNLMKEFFDTFKSFFTKPQAGVAILFMLLYRLPEAQLVKLINPFPSGPNRQRRTGADYRTSWFRLWYYRYHRTDNWRYHWRSCCCTGRIEEVVMANGMEYVPHLSDIHLSELCTGSLVADSQHLYLHRTVRLWFRLHSLYAVSDLFLGRRAQNCPLRHLHRIHGTGNDVTRNGCRMVTGNHRLPTLLRMDHYLLRRYHRSMCVHQDRSELRKEERRVIKSDKR